MKDERRLLARFEDTSKRDAFLADVADLPRDSIRAEAVDKEGARIVCAGPQMEKNVRNLADAHGGSAWLEHGVEIFSKRSG